jgi:hypothetical protein
MQQIFKGSDVSKAMDSSKALASKKPSKVDDDDDSDDDDTSEVDKKRLAMYEKSKLRCLISLLVSNSCSCQAILHDSSSLLLLYA